MPEGRKITLRCPTCRKLVLRGDAEFPFCSERCRLIDLGKWASGRYVISTAISDPEALESIQQPDENRSEENDQDE
jgi:endogenous inhibitor of DNA gyrase (YacG/DUF329 family)